MSLQNSVNGTCFCWNIYTREGKALAIEWLNLQQRTKQICLIAQSRSLSKLAIFSLEVPSSEVVVVVISCSIGDMDGNTQIKRREEEFANLNVANGRLTPTAYFLCIRLISCIRTQYTLPPMTSCHCCWW